MGYIQVKGVGRVYEMEPGDRVVSREGAVKARNDVLITGKTADPERVAAWKRDGLIEAGKKKKKRSTKRKAGK